MMSKGILWVDDRIGAVGLAKPLSDLGYDVTVSRLDSADVVICNTPVGSVGVEVKTVQGLYSDVLTERLYDQLRRMKDAYDISIVLISGFYTTRFGSELFIPGIRTEMSYYFLSMAVMDMQFSGAVVIHCPVEDEVKAVDKLAQHMLLTDLGVNRIKRPDPRKGVPTEHELRALRFLMGIPTVGLGTAKSLLANSTNVDEAYQRAKSTEGKKGKRIRAFLLGNTSTV